MVLGLYGSCGPSFKSTTNRSQQRIKWVIRTCYTNTYYSCQAKHFSCAKFSTSDCNLKDIIEIKLNFVYEMIVLKERSIENHGNDKKCFIPIYDVPLQRKTQNCGWLEYMDFVKFALLGKLCKRLLRTYYYTYIEYCFNSSYRYKTPID